MENLKNKSIGFFIGLIIGAIFAFLTTAEYKDKAFENERLNSLNNANMAILSNFSKIREKEKKNEQIIKELEKNNNDQLSKINNAYTINRRLVNELGGMRDSGKTNTDGSLREPNCSSIGSSIQATSCKLSREATEFLLGYSREADEVAQYANACYEWVTVLESNN